VAVHIDHAGDDTLVTVIRIYGLCAVCAYADDLAAIRLDLSGHKLVGDPNFFTLNDHGKPPTFYFLLLYIQFHRKSKKSFAFLLLFVNDFSFASCIYGKEAV
jgi:hypothetical protein